MKNLKAVIGANFGDEGKGLMTDYLAASCKKGLVVRFNGGAQAGHTVQLPDGKRHVFGHIGAGAFCGLPCYLSSFFVVNPMLFSKETTALKGFDFKPEVNMDGNCMVTTPYDMLINQLAELNRGKSKHGSCGVGFNETITRSLYKKDFSLNVRDLKDPGSVKQKLYMIRDKYVPARLEQLGINTMNAAFASLLDSEGMVLCYLVDVENMLKQVTVCDAEMMSQYDSIVFEGAQGLLLDQNHMNFPHVTRSNTGIKNVVELVKQVGLSGEDVEVIYVTRAYMTRHGAGPFPTELPHKPYPGIEDRTNVPNPYQESLRYGLLDLEALTTTIRQDLNHTEGVSCIPKLAITCMDQLEDEVDYLLLSRQVKTTHKPFIENVFRSLDLKEGYLSYGPTRNTITGFSV